MKSLIIILLLLSLSPLWGQRVFVEEYESQADLKVFVTDTRSQADLRVYKVQYPSQLGPEGLWHFVEYPSQAQMSIHYVEHRSQADLVVDFVEYKSQAGWLNKKKKYLIPRYNH